MSCKANDGNPAPAAVGDELQRLPIQYQWALADSLLLQAIALGKQVQRGPSGTRLGVLVGLLAPLRLLYPLLLMIGALELATLLFRQRRAVDAATAVTPRTNHPQSSALLFVGFGAGPEESLFAEYCARNSLPVRRVDQTRVESMGQLHRVGIIPALTSLLRSTALARKAVASLPETYRPWGNDFVTFVGMRLGHFSFFSAWFDRLKAEAPGVAEVCFLSADTAAFAAVNARLVTRHVQHGLTRHSLVLPSFDRVEAVTHDEMSHFRRRLPNAVITLARSGVCRIRPKRPPCILVASVYDNDEEMRRIVPFLEFARFRGIAVHVRPHPRENQRFWRTGGPTSAVSWEEGDETLAATLERLQPCLVVSWYSTAVADALYHGVIPVSVCALDNPVVYDMVYPLSRRCLCWPRDRNLVERIVSGEVSYEATLSELRAGMEADL